MKPSNTNSLSLLEWIYSEKSFVSEVNALSTGGGSLQNSGNVSGTSGIPVGYDKDREEKLWGKKFKKGEPKTSSPNLKQKQ